MPRGRGKADFAHVVATPIPGNCFCQRLTPIKDQTSTCTSRQPITAKTYKGLSKMLFRYREKTRDARNPDWTTFAVGSDSLCPRRVRPKDCGDVKESDAALGPLSLPFDPELLGSELTNDIWIAEFYAKAKIDGFWIW